MNKKDLYIAITCLRTENLLTSPHRVQSTREKCCGMKLEYLWFTVFILGIYGVMMNSCYNNYQFVDFAEIREFRITEGYCIAVIIDSSNNKH